MNKDLEKWVGLHYLGETLLDGRIEFVKKDEFVYEEDLKKVDWYMSVRYTDDSPPLTEGEVEEFRSYLGSIDLELVKWATWMDDKKIYLDLYMNNKKVEE